ncbi:DegT/DnrJ/EryC1/StrS family aminotransferase [Candidatus Poribacteria bacterium]|nr:DegT/DnrJ/EryC1/StrS family aminotransferase [Candidatus Poribacteria bacterium]MBT5533753.1 DegT/DnrJ/EryC1/StrS family aminotransferase [Candidatus Poribacteria bacterium]MBT5714749.1 DegT/DnrJ/EryC1/StrS family aminotransferase [Candidatus Poribacteria bacterium]MBT7097193.1 DegT/DnrJ/EryC1/StrS family aminotransferase [Candidatus Poribacteria bacterium]MBT7805510.1 DegT/DnrJ/EryC1/StrS family aminotransferase [Candidatus Poribacteria bacterium]
MPITRPYLDEREQELVADVIASGWVTQGPRVEEFEETFAAYVGAPHAVAVTSCTTALHLSLLALGIGPGDEVIIPSMTFIATANAILHAGATPVFVEVHPRTVNIDPQSVEDAITPRTKAIMPVHQIGMPAGMAALLDIGARHGLKIIEDAACAVGSEVDLGDGWEKVGRPRGDLACFSFHPRKLITTGEGGMLTCADEATATRLRRLRHHGMSVSDRTRHSSGRVVAEEYVEVAHNYRMTDLQAAMGLGQMEKLAGIVEARRRLAARYTEHLAEVEALTPPFEPAYARSNYQSYCVRLASDAPCSRDELMQKMLDRGISTRRGIMTIHREPAYADMCAHVELPITERASDETLLIPLYPQMTDDEQDAVIRALKDCAGRE